MADFGHPLLGDDKYGDRTLNKLSSGKLCLWCAGLSLNKNCPLTDYREKKFESPLPAWWEEMQRSLK